MGGFHPRAEQRWAVVKGCCCRYLGRSSTVAHLSRSPSPFTRLRAAIGSLYGDWGAGRGTGTGTEAGAARRGDCVLGGHEGDGGDSAQPERTWKLVSEKKQQVLVGVFSVGRADGARLVPRSRAASRGLGVARSGAVPEPLKLSLIPPSTPLPPSICPHLPPHPITQSHQNLITSHPHNAHHQHCPAGLPV